MLNQIVLVGRLVKTPTKEKTENGNEKSIITIAIPRSYKNADGEYDTDFVDCVLWGNIADNTAEYCKKGDVIGVKGRIQTNTYEKDGEKNKITQIVAERVTFLSSKKEQEVDKTENKDIEI